MHIFALILFFCFQSAAYAGNYTITLSPAQEKTIAAAATFYSKTSGKTVSPAQVVQEILLRAIGTLESERQARVAARYGASSQTQQKAVDDVLGAD